MSEESKGIMLDEECFRALITGGVVISGRIRIALSDIGYARMLAAIAEAKSGLIPLYKDYNKD